MADTCPGRHVAGHAQHAQNGRFQPEFNRSVNIRTSDERITSDAGLLLLREADHRLGLTEFVAASMFDPRWPDRIRYDLVKGKLAGRALTYWAIERKQRAAGAKRSGAPGRKN